ncbi:MAG: peptidoglycan-binding protein [Pyrinomonadaceae bacterium]
MAEHPRGVWIWRLANVSSDYLTTLVQRKVGRVYLKAFDGKSSPMFWGHQCTSENIQRFKASGIEVFGWGYHYGTGADLDAQVAAVKQAVDAGIDGYVLDVEQEVKQPATHANLKKLITRLREFVPAGMLGYTSFGNPAFHADVPWKMLDELCDLAFPQIYFEKFSFATSNEEEVQACLEAHRKLKLTKPILPIWGSESDAKNPATANELQTYLNRFPGSSVWRVPNAGERGEALKLDYSGDRQPVLTGAVRITRLPQLTRVLKRSRIGDDVETLQKALQALGYPTGIIDGDFGPDTERAVRMFQLQAGLTVDGEVGPDTWAALGGTADVERPEQGKLAILADIAQTEAAKSLVWKNASSEAEKYLTPFRAPMKKIGHIGSEPVFYNWCAAFVTWCCRQAGIEIPDQPEGFWATMAKVDAWKFWARQNGFWHPKEGFTPRRGDILVFEWFDGDVDLDHIGIVRGYAPGSELIQTSEGNRGNITRNGDRNLVNVPGFIRLPV